MRAKAQEHVINMLSSAKRFDLVNYACMLLSGDHNREMRQHIVEQLTNKWEPKSKCGVNRIIELVAQQQNSNYSKLVIIPTEPAPQKNSAPNSNLFSDHPELLPAKGDKGQLDLFM